MFKMNERVMNNNNEVIVNTGAIKAKHLPNDPATEAQRRYCYRIMKRMLEKNYALPPEITGYYIYHLMTFKEAYVFIQRYKGVC